MEFLRTTVVYRGTRHLISLLSWTEVGLKLTDSKDVDAPFEQNAVWACVMISRLVPFWELTKFTGSRDLSSSELRYG
jgi:hypothetical protein